MFVLLILGNCGLGSAGWEALGRTIVELISYCCFLPGNGSNCYTSTKYCEYVRRSGGAKARL